MGLLQLGSHARDILALKGAYRVPTPVMEVTLSQMLRTTTDFVVRSHVFIGMRGLDLA